MLPDLAKSCQSSKKVLQEMAKCGQGSQSYTLYTICFTLYALHFTLYTLRFRLKCILGRSVFWSQSVQVSNGDKLRWPKSVRPNCHSGKNIKQPSGSISTKTTELIKKGTRHASTLWLPVVNMKYQNN